MPKYEVIRPWYGVAEGDVIETDALNPILNGSVRLISEGALTPATPEAAVPKRGRKPKSYSVTDEEE